MTPDVLIVGAGFAGLVMAERLSNVLGLRCLVVDKRAHIGGNAHDAYNDAGVLTHVYGPHYFRSNSSKVVDYLSQFTQWLPTSYEIRSFAGGRYWHFPINLNTFEELIGRSSSEQEFKEYLENKRVPIARPQNSEEVIVSQVGWEWYEKFFKGYMLKQWKKIRANWTRACAVASPFARTATIAICRNPSRHSLLQAIIGSFKTWSKPARGCSSCCVRITGNCCLI